MRPGTDAGTGLQRMPGTDAGTAHTKRPATCCGTDAGTDGNRPEDYRDGFPLSIGEPAQSLQELQS